MVTRTILRPSVLFRLTGVLFSLNSLFRLTSCYDILLLRQVLYFNWKTREAQARAARIVRSYNCLRWPTAGVILTSESPCDTKSNTYRNTSTPSRLTRALSRLTRALFRLTRALFPRGVLPYKGLMGTCGQPGYVFRVFCLKQGIDFIIFCLNRGIDFINFCLKKGILNYSKIFTRSFWLNVLNRVSKIEILS